MMMKWRDVGKGGRTVESVIDTVFGGGGSSSPSLPR